MLDAAERGNKAAIISSLEHGANVNHIYNNGRTALIAAALYGHTEVARLLITHGANVNLAATDYKHMSHTALRVASRNGNIDVVKLLLEQGADVDLDGSDGSTALMCAAGNGHRDVVKTLLEYGAHVNGADMYDETALMQAVCSGYTDIVRILVCYGGMLSSALLTENRHIMTRGLAKSGISPLAQAIIARDTDIITRLFAEENGSIFGRFMGYFLTYRVNYRDNFGMTALHWAAAQNYGALVEDLLVEYNPDLDIQDNDGNTALHYAARSGNELILQILLAHGADINAQNNDGNTVLHVAAQAGHTAIVQCLIRHDTATVDFINRINNQRLSAWSLARRCNHQDIVQLLNPIGRSSTASFTINSWPRRMLGCTLYQ